MFATVLTKQRSTCSAALAHFILIFKKGTTQLTNIADFLIDPNF